MCAGVLVPPCVCELDFDTVGVLISCLTCQTRWRVSHSHGSTCPPVVLNYLEELFHLAFVLFFLFNFSFVCFDRVSGFPRTL